MEIPQLSKPDKNSGIMYRNKHVLSGRNIVITKHLYKEFPKTQIDDFATRWG